MNLTTTPLQDNYETVLTQEWDWLTGTIFVANAPDFTFPWSDTTYIIVDAGTTNAQLAEINAVDTALNTITINNISGLELWEGISSTTKVHSTNARVLISDNFQFWKDIKTAVNTKLDNDGWNTTTTWDLLVSGSSFRIRLDAWDMKFTDDNNAEISLSTIAAASWADTKVAISIWDTTPSQLENKLTAWDWVTLTKINPLGNESFDLDVDLTDTTIFSIAWVASRAAVTDWSGNLFQATETARGWVERATDTEVETGTDTTRYISSKQAKDNYWVVEWVVALRDMSLATWVVTYNHGLGRLPNYILVDAILWWGTGNSAISFWVFDWTNNNCSFNRANTTSAGISNSESIQIQQNASDQQRWVIQNLTTTTFDVSWTKSWSPTNSAGITFKVF